MKSLENVLPIEGTGRVVARQDGRLGGILVQEGALAAADVERVLERQRSDGLRRGVSDELVLACQPDDFRAEELRALRTRLVICRANAGPRPHMLAIVSPGGGEGRSYLAANLAVAFAQLGERTLLVDADLRAPRQHRIFELAERGGLSAILSGRVAREAIVPFPEFGPLSILPAGACPPNPQELLLRPGFGALLEQLAADFDTVLFDTPPATAFADAQSLVFRVGGAIVLARKDHTRVADIAGLMRDLEVAGARIFGTVFNAF